MCEVSFQGFRQEFRAILGLQKGGLKRRSEGRRGGEVEEEEAEEEEEEEEEAEEEEGGGGEGMNGSPVTKMEAIVPMLPQLETAL